MLERVPLLEKELADYEEVAGVEAIERIRALAEPLPGRPGPAHQRHRVRRRRGRAALHPRPAAAQPRDRSRVAGHPRQRRVLRGHQGGPQRAAGRATCRGTPHMQKVYLEKVLENALLLEGEWDYVVIHDPQPAALLSFIGDSGVNRPETKWIWRCHIDLTDARDGRLGVLPPVRRAPRRVGVDDGPVHPRVAVDGQHRHRAAVHRPAVGEEPRAARPVRARDLQAVRDRHQAADRLPGQPVRPVEGPGRRHRGVPDRARGGPRRAARARRLDGHRRPRGLPGLGAGRGGARPATATSTCSRTSSRSATCRSTRSSGPPTS